MMHGLGPHDLTSVREVLRDRGIEAKEVKASKKKASDRKESEKREQSNEE